MVIWRKLNNVEEKNEDGGSEWQQRIISKGEKKNRSFSTNENIMTSSPSSTLFSGTCFPLHFLSFNYSILILLISQFLFAKKIWFTFKWLQFFFTFVLSFLVIIHLFYFLLQANTIMKEMTNCFQIHLSPFCSSCTQSFYSK